MVIIPVEILFSSFFSYDDDLRSCTTIGWVLVVEVILLRKGRKRLSFDLDKI